MNEKISISLCMIVKDEADVIARCLNSVRDALDEIIIVDTGSTDNTKSIVEELGAKVYDFEWIDDFAKARNFSFSKATKDYIMWLDADDILLEEDVNKLINLKSNFDTTIDSVTMNYILGQDEYGNATSQLRRNRLVKRSNNFEWIGPVHEYLSVYGNIHSADINVYHKKLKSSGNRNLRIFEARAERGEEFSPRDTFYFANELYYNNRTDEAIAYYEKFINSKQGWVEDNKTACSNIAECYAKKKDMDSFMHYCLKTFQYDIPRADFCCKVAYYFFSSNQLDQAIFWYDLATKLPENKGSLALVQASYSTWIPHIQLCVCYSRQGKFVEANLHNELAAKYIPNNQSVIHNREYLATQLK